MRYKFSTESGSEYLIDTTELTWKRRNAEPGHEGIIGYDVNVGALYILPSVRIGERATLWIGPGMRDYISTTPVDRIEALDYPEVG